MTFSLHFTVCKSEAHGFVYIEWVFYSPIHVREICCCVGLIKEVLFKKELQLFNRVNIPIQNLFIRARSGTALIQSLLYYWVTFGNNS